MSLLEVFQKGTLDVPTVVTATAFAAWSLRFYSRCPFLVFWAFVSFIPLLLATDFHLPLDIQSSAVPSWLSSAIKTATHPYAGYAFAGYVLVTYIGFFFKKRRIPTNFIVDDSVGKGFKIVGKKKEPTMEEIPQLVTEMREAFNAGITRPVEARIEQIKNLRRFFVENEQAICEALKADLGRPQCEALLYDHFILLLEIDHMLAHIHEYAADKPVGFDLLSFPSSQWLQEEPYGVVCVISTWNYPVQLSLSPVLGAIAAGNVVILKPCVVSPTVAKLLTDVLPRYIDSRFLSMVGGNFAQDRHCTAALLEHRLDKVFFTGSPSVGKVVLQGCAKHLTPCVLELGGKNPVFVDHDADIELAAKRTVWGRMMNAGQQCISPDFVLCHKNVVDKFCARAAHYVKELYGDDPKNNGNFGKIVGTKQVERISGLIDTHGGQLVCGGVVDKEAKYVSPTVIKVSLDSPLMAEETFGPILAVVAVESMEAAIRIVNAREKPLSLYVYSSSRATQELIVANTSSGGVTINSTLFHVGHPGLPFGGVGHSGMGAYHGKYSFESFSHRKPVLRKAALWDLGLLSDPFFIYPPWNGTKIAILRALFKLS